MSKASLAFAALLLIPTLGISSTEQVPSKQPMTAQQFLCKGYEQGRRWLHDEDVQ